jgi:hypothetical protein
MSKMRICEYFDELTRRLDVLVDAAINDNQHRPSLQDALRTQRDLFIEEIRQVKAFNLKALAYLESESCTSQLDGKKSTLFNNF